MADEIKLTVSMIVENGSFKETISPGQVSITQSAVGRGGGVQIIGTTEEVVGVGDVANSGYAFFRNLDSTNWVEFGPQNSGGAMLTFGKLLPSEVAVFRIKPGVVVRAKADTAAVKLDVRVFET